MVGFFQMSSGLSGEQAANLLKSADALAVANGVAPGAVLKDIAEFLDYFFENSDYDRTKNPVIIVGGSYAGSTSDVEGDKRRSSQ